MTSVNSLRNNGHENIVMPCKFVGRKRRIQSTGTIKFSGEIESIHLENSAKSYRSINRCTSSSSAIEFSDKDSFSSTSTHVSMARSILDSLSDDEDEGDEIPSSSFCSQGTSKLSCHRRLDSITLEASFSNTTSTPLSLLFMAHPINSCDSMVGNNISNSTCESDTTTEACKLEGRGIICQHETQALDWSDSISQFGYIRCPDMGS